MYEVSWIYLVALREAAFSAAEPGLEAESDMYESAVVQATVTSQVNGFPSCQGMRVRPSGLFPSVRDRPDGSSIAGIPAEISAR